ncbi:MAG: ABC transporter ATP-binding protein [Candidatus Dojkabacteria bacterium]
MKTRIKQLHTLQFFWNYLKSEWKLYAVTLVGVSIAKVATAYTPVYYKQLVDAATMEVNNTAIDIAIHALLMILILKLIAWVWDIVEYIGLNFGVGRSIKKIYDHAFSYMHRHSYGFFTNSFTGTLVSRINKLATSFDVVVSNTLENLIELLLQLSVALFLISQVSIHISAIILVWVLVFTVISFYISKYAYKLDRIADDYDSKLSGKIADAIANHFNITLFAKHTVEDKRIQESTTVYSQAQIKSWNAYIIASSVPSILIIVLEVIVTYIFIQSWKEGALTAGDFVLLQTLLLQIYGEIRHIGSFMRRMASSFSDAAEGVKILTTPHEISDSEDAGSLNVEEGRIEVKNLQFGYSEEKAVYQNFSLTIEPGKRVALVSKSGGGKSTLVKLLLRLYNIPENAIFIDGQDIMKVTLESLRKSISLVPQEPVLFHRTLRENIAYAKPEATIEEIIEAAKKAHCHEFIAQLPERYDTLVGERGIKLSGGERQRVAIARAILENAPILILDEATSALDSESEHLIQEALHELMKGKTTIAIAHRLSTIMEMDEIIVLEHGSVIERGSHTALVNSPKSLYKNLWEIQAGGFSEHV